MSSVPIVPTPLELAERLTRVEARLAALETAAAQEATRIEDLAKNEGVRADELAKVAWSVAHGRKRPW